MANPWGIPAVGWGVVFMGWLLSPMFSLLWAKLFAYLASDTSRKLRVLEIDTIPSLKKMLRDVEQQRMEATTKDKGSVSDLATLKKIENDLKSALCEAEDILDLIDYYQIERKVLGDRSWDWVQHLLSTAGACITRCKESWFVTRTETILRAAVLQCAKGLCWLWSTLWRSGGQQEQIPISQRPSNPVVQKLRVWSQSLDIKALCRSMQRWLAKTYVDACFYRDWSYEVVGIKSNQQKDNITVVSFLPTIDRKSLRKRMENIENIVNDSKKSHLLSQQSSSSNTNPEESSISANAEESSSSTNPEESSRRQEEIDNLHIRIDRKVFGRDEDRDRICRMLREGADPYGPSSSSSKPYSVIGIYGIAGSGKSTLAQYVCDYEKARQNFDTVMFIHVTENFRIDKIFRDMLREIEKKQQSDSNGVETLRDKLEDKLKNKCFLLVLDDLWVNDKNKKGRDILLDTLKAGQCGSRILVTARREDAAAALGAQEQIPIPDLEEEQYFSMFMHNALEGTSSYNERYASIGRKIVKKLCRSPIAAITVAARLKGKSTRYWESTANDDVLNKTMGALWWSYQQLDADIRRCFAYCSTFPKGYKLKRDRLVRIWIAQGFVNTRSDATEELEDVGERYFDELLTFSFLQVQGTTLDTKLTWIETFTIHGLLHETEAFTIHDLLHELAERVAGCDFHRIDLDWSPKDIPQGVRHVFIETKNVAEIAENNLDMGNLRTLIIKEHRTDTDRNHDLEKVFENLFMRMRKLRVLIVELNHETEGSRSVPASIDQMKHLRYFGFKYKLGSGDNRLILPSTISKLYHMQTIKVCPYYRVSYPEDMSNLIHLRHISRHLIFPNVGRLTSLQTLPRFRVREERGYELKQLKHLNKLRGTLEIDDLGNAGSKEEALEAHLTQKKRLTKLELSFYGCGSRGEDIVADVFEGLCPPEDLQELAIWDYNCSLRYPSWMLSRQHPDAPKRLQILGLIWCSRLASIPEDSVFFKGLLQLRIQACNWDSLPENMERLVSLQDLIIDCCEKMELLPTLPQSLQTLIICSCDKMELLPTLPQSLQTLIIRSCNKMELLPTLPQSLRKIQIIFCSVLRTTCKEEGHENWHKIQHIPEKLIC
ncbi:unnamed protein product [Urochloa humidicola]